MQSPSVQEIAAFLLKVERHEQDGLTHRCAVLAAATDCDVDPAAVLRGDEGAAT